jgi:two-component system cell cycle sensor histidine kinase/response regulator CckA
VSAALARLGGWGALPAAAAALIACGALAGELIIGASGDMVPSAALITLLTAVSLLSGERRFLPWVVIGAAVVTLVQHALGSADDGLMAANSAACFVVLGASLLLVGRGSGTIQPSDAGALVAAAVALLALLGHLFGVPGLQRGLSVTPMALPTAFSILLLAVGIVFAVPSTGLAALLLSGGPGGALVRRLAPTALLAPIALAYARLEGQRAGWYGTAEGLAIYCASLIVLFVALIIVTGRALDRLGAARRAGAAREAAILDATVDAVLTVDGDGNVLDANTAATRMFGNAVGRGLHELLSTPSPRPLGRAVEGTARRADGSEFPVEVTVNALRDAFVVYVRDITERVAGERAARHLAALVEYSGDAIIGATPDGVITGWNRAAERIYGYTRDEALGRTLQDLLLPPERKGAALDERSRQLEQEGTLSSEAEHVRRDGSRFPVEATISVIRDADGESVGLSLIARDITRRREHDAVVQRLAAIVERSSDAIFTFDADGVITSWNSAAERIYGYAAEEILGRPLAAISSNGELMVSEFVARVAGGETVTREGTAVRKDGRKVDTFYTAFPLAEGGGVIARDVTERRRLEEQLRQSQKMEAVGQLAGGVAHDFNNLLTVITGYGDLARAIIGDGAGAKELAEIEKAAQRAASLTQQLLAFSRRQIVNPEVLDLNEVVGGLLPMLQRLIGEDIAVITRFGNDLPPVHADMGQLEQVVMNLAVNARDAMPDGGALTIETAEETIDLDGEPVRCVCIAVSDTGVGIEPEALPHIFEPFYTTKPVGEGTGLGLATVHGAVTQSGGRVTVDSEPGRGTTFRVYLPATQAAQESHDDSPEGERQLRGSETLLVCEDEQGVRDLLERLLTRAGYRVLCASRPREALALAREEPAAIHGLVTDVIMPDMPGPELARHLQGMRPGMRTLFLSGYTADTVHRRGNLPPGSAFLEKPFDRVSLLRTVRELLDRGLN